MDKFKEYLADISRSIENAAGETRASLDGEFREHEEPTEDPTSANDPVRVYLREMGEIRLLNRQGEIDLARRMERGNLRMRKALSRSRGSVRSGCTMTFNAAVPTLTTPSSLAAWSMKPESMRIGKLRVGSRRLLACGMHSS